MEWKGEADCRNITRSAGTIRCPSNGSRWFLKVRKLNSNNWTTKLIINLTKGLLYEIYIEITRSTLKPWTQSLQMPNFTIYPIQTPTLSMQNRFTIQPAIPMISSWIWMISLGASLRHLLAQWIGWVMPCKGRKVFEIKEIVGHEVPSLNGLEDMMDFLFLMYTKL